MPEKDYFDLDFIKIKDGFMLLLTKDYPEEKIIKCQYIVDETI